MSISVCIFARNEALHLPRCIAALDAASDGLDYRAHILVNGCDDDTGAVAAVLAAANPRITVHELPVGDKAHAWNEYVFRIARKAALPAKTHIFLDGDIRPGRGAVAALSRAINEAPEAYGAAALPASGRSRHFWAAHLRRNHYLSGNLYALSQEALCAFRSRKLRLPFGAKGEDGIIAYLLLTNFRGGSDDRHREKIVVAEDASFEFDPLTFNARDIAIYRRRLRRYSERHFQKSILYRRLKSQGASAMPENIYDIYTDQTLTGLYPRPDPVNFWFDTATLRRLRRGKGQPQPLAG